MSDCGDEEWGEPADDDADAHQESGDSDASRGGGGGGAATEKKRKRGRPKGTGGKPAKGKAAKGTASSAAAAAKQAAKKCFAASCMEQKCLNSTFCRQHNRFAESMKYQAAQTKELSAYKDVMNDPSKAQVALEDWERDNPEGSSRKRLICWATFRERHGVRVAFTIREGEVQMGIDDYWVHRGQAYGKTRAQSDNEFKEKVNTGKFETEGSGANITIWTPKLKERNRDTTTFVENEADESSKSLKDPSQEEREHLRDVAKTSGAVFSDRFLQNPASSINPVPKKRKRPDDGDDAGEDDDQDESAGGPCREAQILDEAPRQHGKLNKELPGIRKSLCDAVGKLEDHLKITEKQDDKDDPELLAYRNTACFRLRLGKLWLAETMEEAKELANMQDNQVLLKYGIHIAVPVEHDAAAASAEQAEAAADANADAVKEAGGEEKKLAEGAVGAATGAEAAGTMGAATGAEGSAAAEQGKDKGADESRSVAGSSGNSKRVGPIVSKLLQDLIKAAGRQGKTVHQVDDLRGSEHFNEILDQVLGVNTVKDLDELLATWRSAADQVKLLAAGIAKSANNVKAHVDASARKALRKEKMEEKAKEQKLVDHVKKTAKEAAAKVKELEAEAPPLFKQDLPKLQQQGVFKKVVIHEQIEGAAINLAEPFVLAECSAVTDWSQQAKIQVALGNFGGKYKKKSSYQSEGKVQMVLYSREGKEESHNFFNLFIEAVPAGKVADAKGTAAASTCENIWLYGL